MKNNYFIYSILILFLLIISCSKNNNKVQITEKEKSKIMQIDSLTDIYKFKKKIKLKNVKKLYYFLKIKTNEEYFLATKLISGNIHLFLWDIKGNYIGQAGRPGKGPGEYVALGGLTFDDKNHNIFYIFDNLRNIIMEYQIKKNKIKFIKQKNLNNVLDTNVDQLFIYNGKFYMISSVGQKGAYKIIILNKKFEIIKKMFKRKHSGHLRNSCYAVSNDKLFLLGEFDKKHKMYENYIYAYNLKSNKLINKINIKEDTVFDINVDKSKKFLLISIWTNMLSNKKPIYHKIYDINGKYYKTIHQQGLHDYKKLLGINRTCKTYKNKIFIFKPDKNSESKVLIYDIDFGLK